MNPYDFARIDPDRPVQRRQAIRHDRFSGWAGRLEGTIMTLTPVFIPGANRRNQFQLNGQGKQVIPGSTLKGLFRSLVETIGPGCWWLFDGRYEGRRVDYQDKLPTTFLPCHTLAELCPACRLFGMINRGTLVAGNVSFSDAVCEHAAPHAPIFTPILDTPKPRHAAWYLDAAGKNVAGRKFYFHQGSIKTEERLITSASGRNLNSQITPLGVGSSFRFTADYSGLEDSDFALLLYAVVLEPDLAHKVGYAKPAGLGSVKIALTAMRRQSMLERYSGEAAETYEGAALGDRVDDLIRPYVTSSTVTLQDLRRIWSWPPSGSYAYPTRQWFTDNPTEPISTTA